MARLQVFLPDQGVSAGGPPTSATAVSASLPTDIGTVCLQRYGLVTKHEVRIQPVYIALVQPLLVMRTKEIVNVKENVGSARGKYSLVQHDQRPSRSNFQQVPTPGKRQTSHIHQTLHTHCATGETLDNYQGWWLISSGLGMCDMFACLRCEIRFHLCKDMILANSPCVIALSFIRFLRRQYHLVLLRSVLIYASITPPPICQFS